jgi:hypothetical protein
MMNRDSKVSPGGAEMWPLLIVVTVLVMGRITVIKHFLDSHQTQDKNQINKEQ